VQIGNTKITRFVESLEYESPAMDAVIPRIPIVEFDIGAWPDFGSLRVIPVLESGFETEELFYLHLANVGYFTEVTMCRYNAADWPDLTNMPPAWGEDWVLAYTAAWEAWWGSLSSKGSEVSAKLAGDGIVAALDMEATDGSDYESTFDAWDAITTVNGSLRSNYGWMADIPAGSEIYGVEVAVPRAAINTYVGNAPSTTIYPIANVLAMIAANDPATATVWLQDPIHFKQGADADGGRSRYKAYCKAILAAGVELIILFPGVELADRAAQDAIILAVWSELMPAIHNLSPTSDGYMHSGNASEVSTGAVFVKIADEPGDESRGGWTFDASSVSLSGRSIRIAELKFAPHFGYSAGSRAAEVYRFDPVWTNASNWTSHNGAGTTPAQAFTTPASMSGLGMFVPTAAMSPLLEDAIKNRSGILSFGMRFTSLVADWDAAYPASQENATPGNRPILAIETVLIPTITCTAGDLAYTAGSGAVVVDPGIVIATDDPGEAEIVEARVTVAGAATLSLTGHASFTIIGSGTGSITLESKGAATAVDLQDALRDLTFTTAETSGTFAVEFEFDDIYDQTSAAASRNINVTEPGGGVSSLIAGRARRVARAFSRLVRI
jgi:hypothetical protein